MLGKILRKIIDLITMFTISIAGSLCVLTMLKLKDFTLTNMTAMIYLGVFMGMVSLYVQEGIREGENESNKVR